MCTTGDTAPLLIGDCTKHIDFRRVTLLFHKGMWVFRSPYSDIAKIYCTADVECCFLNVSYSFPIINFCNPRVHYETSYIIFKTVWGSTVTRIYDGRSVVQILAATKDLSFLQNIQNSSSTRPASKSSFISGSKVATADSQTTSIRLQSSLYISGAIPQHNLLISMAHIVTTLFYILPMYISLNSSCLTGLKKVSFIHYLPLTCTLHEPFISSSLFQLHYHYEHLH